MKKLKATNENDIETSPASSCFRSLKRDATEAVMDEYDIEMEIILAEELLQGDMKRNRALKSDSCETDPHTRENEVQYETRSLASSWESLNEKLTVVAEKEQMSRFKKMQEYGDGWQTTVLEGEASVREKKMQDKSKDLGSIGCSDTT